MGQIQKVEYVENDDGEDFDEPPMSIRAQSQLPSIYSMLYVQVQGESAFQQSPHRGNVMPGKGGKGKLCVF